MSNYINVDANIDFNKEIDFGDGGYREINICEDDVSVEIDLDDVDDSDLLCSIENSGNADAIANFVRDEHECFIPLILDNACDKGIRELLDYLSKQHSDVLLGWFEYNLKPDPFKVIEPEPEPNNDKTDPLIAAIPF